MKENNHLRGRGTAVNQDLSLTTHIQSWSMGPCAETPPEASGQLQVFWGMLAQQ